MSVNGDLNCRPTPAQTSPPTDLHADTYSSGKGAIEHLKVRIWTKQFPWRLYEMRVMIASLDIEDYVVVDVEILSMRLLHVEITCMMYVVYHNDT